MCQHSGRNEEETESGGMEIFGSSTKEYSSTFNLWFMGSCGFGLDAPEMACVKVIMGQQPALYQ